MQTKFQLGLTKMVSLHLRTSFLNADAFCKPGYPISAGELSHDVIASFSHQMEHVQFDARNPHEKNLAASRYDTRTSFSCELKFRIQVSYIWHQPKRGRWAPYYASKAPDTLYLIAVCITVHYTCNQPQSCISLIIFCGGCRMLLSRPHIYWRCTSTFWWTWARAATQQDE